MSHMAAVAYPSLRYHAVAWHGVTDAHYAIEGTTRETETRDTRYLLPRMLTLKLEGVMQLR